ncbi:fibrinogen alpha chain-like [Saccostrea cucullata]|uniref:fibrinogen alpha chain-like n=1 Tax=Saccostrea cuccullata TaxID=36930 RepID=UPI002ED64DA5
MKISQHLKTLFIILNVILCCHGDLKAGYSSIQYGYRLLYRLIESYVNYSILDCVEECLRTKRCRSVNYYKGANFCEINFRRKENNQKLYREASGWLYTDIQYWDKVLAGSCAGPPCKKNYEKCIPKPFGQYECVLSDCGIPVNKINTTWDVHEWDGIGIRKRIHIKCLESFKQRGSGMIVCHKNGTWITDLVCQAKDCMGLRENGHTDSGVYEIYPFGTDPRPVRVYCDMNTMGGGWTAIQNRVNGSVSFERIWDEYKKGFGDAGQDFWIGNY